MRGPPELRNYLLSIHDHFFVPQPVPSLLPDKQPLSLEETASRRQMLSSKAIREGGSYMSLQERRLNAAQAKKFGWNNVDNFYPPHVFAEIDEKMNLVRDAPNCGAVDESVLFKLMAALRVDRSVIQGHIRTLKFVRAHRKKAAEEKAEQKASGLLSRVKAAVRESLGLKGRTKVLSDGTFKKYDSNVNVEHLQRYLTLHNAASKKRIAEAKQGELVRLVFERLNKAKAEVIPTPMHRYIDSTSERTEKKMAATLMTDYYDNKTIEDEASIENSEAMADDYDDKSIEDMFSSMTPSDNAEAEALLLGSYEGDSDDGSDEGNYENKSTSTLDATLETAEPVDASELGQAAVLTAGDIADLIEKAVTDTAQNELEQPVRGSRSSRASRFWDGVEWRTKKHA